MKMSSNVGSNISKSYLNLVNTVKNTAEILGLTRERRLMYPRNNNKPWFVSECFAAKRHLKSKLKLCRKK